MYEAISGLLLWLVALLLFTRCQSLRVALQMNCKIIFSHTAKVGQIVAGRDHCLQSWQMFFSVWQGAIDLIGHITTEKYEKAV